MLVLKCSDFFCISYNNAQKQAKDLRYSASLKMFTCMHVTVEDVIFCDGPEYEGRFLCS